MAGGSAAEVFPSLKGMEKASVIYVIYSRYDKASAEALFNYLDRERGFKVLCSDYKAYPGYTYEENFEYNLLEMAGAKCIIALVSGDSLMDYFFKMELKNACTKDVPVLALLISGTSLQDVEKQCKFDTSKITETAGFEQLMRELESSNYDEIRAALAKAASHSEISQYEAHFIGNPAVKKLAEAAHDRLDDERRIRDDIENTAKACMAAPPPEPKKRFSRLRRGAKR